MIRVGVINCRTGCVRGSRWLRDCRRRPHQHRQRAHRCHGAAGGAASVNADASLERGEAPLGALAVDDGRGKESFAAFGAAVKVTTIEPLMRLAVQQSNCFVITSIGNNRTESKLSNVTDKQRNSGEFRAGSRQQKGQRVAADYYMEPAIIIDNELSPSAPSGLPQENGLRALKEGKV